MAIVLTEAELDHLYPDRVREREKVTEVKVCRAPVKRPAVPGNNLRIYGDTIKAMVLAVGDDDLRWLANRSARIYKRLDKQGGCVDNYRVCVMHGSRFTNDYAERRSQGCCGYYDEVWANPKTGNRFCIGFNYGH